VQFGATKWCIWGGWYLLEHIIPLKKIIKTDAIYRNGAIINSDPSKLVQSPLARSVTPTIPTHSLRGDIKY
jgi:hypothetical protein